MRQLNPLTNIVLACVAAVGLVASLSLPWYAPTVVVNKDDLVAVAEGQSDGPMQHFSHWISRVFSSDGHTMTGSSSLGDTKVLILVLAIAIASMCLVMLIPAMRPFVRDFVRAVSLAAPLIVAYLGFSKPGTVQLEIRWGLVVAVAVSLFMASCAWQAGAVRKKKIPMRAATRFSN